MYVALMFSASLRFQTLTSVAFRPSQGTSCSEHRLTRAPCFVPHRSRRRSWPRAIWAPMRCSTRCSTSVPRPGACRRSTTRHERAHGPLHGPCGAPPFLSLAAFSCARRSGSDLAAARAPRWSGYILPAHTACRSKSKLRASALHQLRASPRRYRTATDRPLRCRRGMANAARQGSIIDS